MSLSLKRLEYFVAVADEPHFGRAAKRLHMAQPPLSQQIQQLESELGVKLFERSTRRVALTSTGRLIYPEARRLLAEAEAVERRVGEIRAGDGGTLRLGFVDSTSYEVLPRFLQTFRSRYPAVDYELRSMSSDEQLTALRDGRIDLGISRTADRRPDIRNVTVARERLWLAVPEGHRLAGQRRTSLRRLAGEVFVGFDRQVSRSFHEVLRSLLADAGVDYDPVIEAPEYTTIIGLVASGQGIAVVPAGIRSFQPPGLAYLALSDRAATTDLLMLTRADDAGAVVDRAVATAVEVFS